MIDKIIYDKETNRLDFFKRDGLKIIQVACVPVALISSDLKIDIEVDPTPLIEYAELNETKEFLQIHTKDNLVYTFPNYLVDNCDINPDELLEEWHKNKSVINDIALLMKLMSKRKILIENDHFSIVLNDCNFTYEDDIIVAK